MDIDNKLSYSIIICTKDRPDDMVKCLDSIIKQTLIPKEVIVVDSSEDNRVELVVLDDKIDSLNIIYIHSSPGLTKQRNIGVKKSTGDILFFLDDDIVLEPDFSKIIMSDFLKDHENNIGGIQGIDLNIKIIEKVNYKHLLYYRLFLLDRSDTHGKLLPSGNVSHLNEGIKDIRFSKINKKTNVLCGGYVGYRRKIFEHLSFDESYIGYSHGEDVDFSHRVSKKYELYLNPNAKVYHNQDTNKLNWYKSEEYIRSNLKASLYLFRKHKMRNPLNYCALFWSWFGWLFWIFNIQRNKSKFRWCLNAINSLKWDIFKRIDN